LSAVAGRVGASFREEDGSLRLQMLGQEYRIFPDGVRLCGQKAPENQERVVIDYLTSSGTRLIELPWRSWGDFGGGSGAEFRQRVELPLAQHVTDFIERANVILPLFDAQPAPSVIGSDLAITVSALPRIRLHIELSRESQDFPSEAWFLFSHNANEFLGAASLQVLGELCKDRILSLIRIY
jgi:Domain of unknown function (DUF3786)